MKKIMIIIMIIILTMMLVFIYMFYKPFRENTFWNELNITREELSIDQIKDNFKDYNVQYNSTIYYAMIVGGIILRLLVSPINLEIVLDIYP